jgi:serine phosphatase RsbU (regulator of sigma subunit)
VPVVGDRFALGRATECDVVLTAPSGIVQRSADDSVSRRHAVLISVDGNWYVEDGDGYGRPSRNGTYLNTQRVTHPARVALHHKDQIRICDVLLAFHSDPESNFTAEAYVSHADTRQALEAQSADRLRLLLDAGTALRATLDQDAVLDRTLEHLFRMFPQAERGIVVFREEPNGPLAIRALRTPRGDPADPRFSTTVIHRCLEAVEAVLGNDLPRQFPEAESIGLLSGQSLMVAPLWTPEGRALGAVQLDTHVPGRKFNQDDLRLLLGVAGQASLSLSMARLHRASLVAQRQARDMEVAQQVQRALLPGALPSVQGYSFYAHYAAADQVGGDYYDFVPLAAGKLAILLGDVSGHGVGAALVMARFGAEARACLEVEPDPAKAVARMNNLVVRAAVPESFVTLAGVILDPSAHTATVVSAGHPSPLLRRVGGGIDELLPCESIGLVLGVVGDQKYQCRELQLEPGESILLYSDGVTEAMDRADRQFGMGGVRAVFATAGPSPQATIEALASAVKRHSAGGSQSDDITLVCITRGTD